MKKRLLTLDDLYNYYCSSSTSCYFNSQNENENIVVQIDGKIKFSQKNNSSEGLLPVTLQSCHIGENVNGSNIDEEVMTAALPSFSNRPILGYIHEVDGQLEFYGHNMHINENDELIYDEIPIGIIPESCNARLEYDKNKKKTYCVVDGYIFEEYTKAAEILQREEECSVSVELSIRELSYNAKEKHLNIEDFFFSGVTILGKDKDGEEVKPGMVGSNIQLADFSRANNSLFSNTADTKLIETLEKLNDTLTTISNFNINNAEGKEDNQVPKFEELLEKYGKTVEDITFDYEGLSDEELEVAFAEAFEEDKEVESAVSEEEHVEEESEEESIEENVEEGSEEEIENEEAEETFTNKWSVIDSNGTIHEFELSLDDIQSALYNLINDTYSEADNAWYSVSVYDTHVIMHDWWNSKNYKQTYKRDEDSFTLTGDRVEVFANWLTKDEENSLAELRSNYSSIKAELETYQKAEATAKKDALFTSDEYKVISGETEFKELSNNHVEFSYEELKTKLDSIVLSYVKSGNLKFSNEETKSNRIAFSGASATEKKKPYGNLFK